MSKVKSTTWNGDPRKYVHLKVDGHYTRITVSASGRVTVWTSRPTDITEKCKRYDWLRPFLLHVPNESVVLGEIYAKGATSSDVKTLLNAGSNELQFRAFAVETLPTTAPLEDVQAWCQQYGIPFLPFRLYGGESRQELLDSLPLHGEGYVLKDGNLLAWQKVKPANTIDVIVDGYTEGRGRHFGVIGAMKCRTIDGTHVANVAGMSDDDRYDITYRQDELIGAVCEVKYQSITPKGKLRHPRFIKWRDDKLPEACTLDQDPRLEEYWLNQ